MTTQGLTGIKTLKDIDVKDKRVFLRLDLNVPLEGKKITDTTRIDAALPTIRYLLENKAKLVVGSHLGRPKSAGGKNFSDKKYSLEPVAEKLTELLKVDVTFVDDPESDAPKMLLREKSSNKLILLENLRFSVSEEKNGPELAKKIASYTDIYINDAFGASHRAHSSIVTLPEMMSTKGIAFLMEKEISMLDRILTMTDRPFTAIMGGSKVSDKIGVIDNIIDRVDTFIIGGAMSYTFLKAAKVATGNSKIETDWLTFAKEFIQRVQARDKKLLLPVDHVIADSLDKPKTVKVTEDEAIPDGFLGLDIGPKTQELYAKAILKSKIVFWNGPMGVFENPKFEKGTFAVAKAMSNVDGFTFVGGGDSAAAMNASGYSEKVSHISTGGGASLEYLQGDKLPGLEVLRMKQ